MVIYLNPPTGSVSLATIERLCTVRFEFVKYLMNVNNLEEFIESTSIEYFVQNSDCLMEHNPSDKLSFFTLRLLSLQSARLRSVTEAGERRLLRYRLQLMSPAELRDTLCRTAARAARLRAPLPEGSVARRLLDTLVSVTAAAERHLAEGHGEETRTEGTDELRDCREPVVRVPFASVAPLVAARSVSLSDGWALLLCRDTPAALACLQDSVLALAPRGERPSLPDHRLLPLLTRLCAKLEPVGPLNSASLPLSLVTLDASAPLLPPCMLALRAELRGRHRLTHRDRITLSAFLKDAGLPLEDNVRFWEREYCQPAGHGSSCSHSWSRCQRRYLYSLRHMYGLEGKRVPFQSHSCRQLQERSGESITSCGGCPFVGFDTTSLTTLLTSEAGLSAAEAAPLVDETGAEPTVRCRQYRSLLLRRRRVAQGPGTREVAAGARAVAVDQKQEGQETRMEGTCRKDTGGAENLQKCEENGGCDRVASGRTDCDNGSAATDGAKICPPAAKSTVASEDRLREFETPAEFFRSVLSLCPSEGSGTSDDVRC